MKHFFRVIGVVVWVMTFVVSTTEGQTLEERIRAIEINIQQLQKDMAELKYVIDTLTSQKRVIPTQPSSHNFGLELSDYKVGETLGENLVIKEDSNEDKYISCSKSGGVLGKLKFSSIGLSNKSEVIIRADWNSNSWGVFIISDVSTIILSQHSQVSSYFEIGDEKEKKSIEYSKTGWKGGTIIENINISIRDSTVNIYINDFPAYSYTLHKPGTEYHTLIINGIQDKDQIFGVTWKDL